MLFVFVTVFVSSSFPASVTAAPLRSQASEEILFPDGTTRKRAELEAAAAAAVS